MKQFEAKFRLIYIPFLLITIVFIGTYTFLHWVLFIKAVLYPLDEDILNLFVPFLLPWIPLLIWVRPRIKLLNLKSKNTRSDPLMAYLMLCWIIMAVPTIIAQQYLVTASGKLTDLDWASGIRSSPPTKYYKIKQYYAGKSFVHLNTKFSVTGKGNTDFNMTTYVCVPLFDHVFPDTNMIAAIRNGLNSKGLVIINGSLSNIEHLKRLPADSVSMMRYLNPSLVMPKYGDTGKYGAVAVVTKSYRKIKAPLQKISPPAWLAIKYSKTISNSLSVGEKDQSFRNFNLQSYLNFQHNSFSKFVYLDRVPYGKDLKQYIAAIKVRGDVDEDALKELNILSPVYTPFETHNGNKLGWIFGSMAIGSAVFLISLLFKPLRRNASENVSD